MATRAAHRASSSRGHNAAATDHSHLLHSNAGGSASSGSERSTKSGRERRRDGKNKMQATILQQRNRIQQLEAQVSFFRALVAEMTTKCPDATAVAPGVASALHKTSGPLPQLAASSVGFFDLYDYDACHAAVQTDISIHHQHANRFFAIGVDGRPAGLDFGAEHSSADAAAEEHAAVAVNAITAGCADAAAGNLAESPEPCKALMVTSPTPPTLLENGGGTSSTTLGAGTTLQDISGITAHASLRAFDAISEDAMPALKDFNSQDLACSSAFSPDAEAVASAATGVIGVGSPRTTPSTPGSSNPGSSSSAGLSTCNFKETKSSRDGDIDDNSGNMPCGRSATAQTQCGQFATVNIGNSCDVEQSLKDFNSNHIANMTVSDTELEDFDSYNLASQCGPLPARLSPELLDAKSSDSIAQLCTVSSQNLANTECALARAQGACLYTTGASIAKAQSQVGLYTTGASIGEQPMKDSFITPGLSDDRTRQDGPITYSGAETALPPGVGDPNTDPQLREMMRKLQASVNAMCQHMR